MEKQLSLQPNSKVVYITKGRKAALVNNKWSSKVYYTVYYLAAGTHENDCNYLRTADNNIAFTERRSLNPADFKTLNLPLNTVLV